MAEDIKSLSKRITEIEKRLKFNEARIKVIADSMTDSKDIEKYLDVLYKKMGRELAESEKVSRKLQERQIEMSEKAAETREKERDREWEKENQRQQKEMDKIINDAKRQNKESIRQAEMNVVLARLANVEASVAKALSKK